MSSAELVARLRAGDEEAYDAIFRQWYAPVVRAAEAVVRERAVAEELAQDVMLELWRRRERLAPDVSIQAYLLRAVRNRALNHVRHLRVEREGAPYAALPPAREAEAPSTIAASEITTAFEQALDELPPRCREVFELSRGQGLRYSEIATRLGVSVKAVEAHMGRALRTMRERLAPWLPGGDRL